MELSYEIYRPDDYAKGIVQLMHGMTEHSGFYKEFARYLRAEGFVVITYDHRGHGNNSEEGYGYFGQSNGWLNLVEDAYLISQIVKKEYPPTTPFILFGHSMGSMVARSYLKRYDKELDGLILCGPPTKNNLAQSGIILTNFLCKVQGSKKTNKFLESMVTGKFVKKVKKRKTNWDWISYNQDNVEQYIADEACGFRFTNRGYHDLIVGMKDIFKTKGWKVENKSVPILFVSGEDDLVTGGKRGRKKSVNYLKKVGYTKIDEIIYHEMRHSILNESGHEKVFQDIAHWINEQVCR